MIKRALSLILILALCCCAVTVRAVSSPMLESFAGSGIRKKEPPGKLQKTIQAMMRAAKSTRLKDVVTENDLFLDDAARETTVKDAEIETIFTPEIYRVKKDGTADFMMQLADANAFSGKNAAVVVGIPQKTGNPAGVTYIEIPAQTAHGQVQAVFPAWVIEKMRQSISSGWNCVCLVVSREKDEMPADDLFELSTEEETITI